MNVYLAAPFSYRARIRPYRKELQALGFTVTASWLDYPDDAPNDSDLPEAERTMHAELCKGDVLASDILIYFKADAEYVSRGGKDVEFGIAAAKGCRLILVGDKPKHVFTALKQVEHYETWDECFCELLYEQFRKGALVPYSGE